MARAMNMLHVLPSAFLYQFAGTGTAATGTVEKFHVQAQPAILARLTWRRAC